MTFNSQRGNYTPLIKKCYEIYFECKIGDQGKSLAPNNCCVTCLRLLTGWVSNSRQMPFAVPMVWMEPTDPSFVCYFCLTNIKGITSQFKHTVKCPDLPLQWGLSLTMVACTKASGKSDFWRWHSDSDEDCRQQLCDNVDSDPTFEASCSSSEPNLDVSTMAKWYQGKWNSSMLTDYWWTFRRDVPKAKYSRKSSTVIFR